MGIMRFLSMLTYYVLLSRELYSLIANLNHSKGGICWDIGLILEFLQPFAVFLISSNSSLGFFGIYFYIFNANLSNLSSISLILVIVVIATPLPFLINFSPLNLTIHNDRS